MSEPECLFGELPEQVADERPEVAQAAPRLREPQRDQIELRVVDLNGLLPLDHPARAVWAFVEQLDLSPLLDAIKAREGEPGHPPANPQIPMALWLYATIDAVGSARALARLCQTHVAYQWICGGVSMNYHTLSDFRVAHVSLLDRLLAEGVTALVSEGLVQLQRLAQDGVRVRASAGAASYRRRPRLEKLLKEAESRVAMLRAELETDPAASTARQRAARQRAAQEQMERTTAALERMKQLEAERARRAKTHKKDTQKQKEPRASTTDAEARVMKMADGGYRPAYNGQFASDPETQVIVAVDIDTTGSDHGLIGPMQDQIGETYGQTPKQYLVDGGFTKLEDIERAHEKGIEVFAPPPNNKHETDPFAPRKDDGPGSAEWRKRMSSEDGKAVYRHRAKAECVNADLRNRGIQRLLLRGREKVRAVLLWFALAHNLMRAVALRGAAAQAAAAG
ncbi:MAG TPA: IS1182 family transposase [Acetobacteraceae bacterium]|nr:IS1182 family transposase [Acetobacteraceae bacterium]